MNFMELLKKPKTEKTRISDLPSPIMCDIISLLPNKSIMSCKLVSKPWCSHIRDPDFSNKSSKYITVIVRREVDSVGDRSLHLVQPEVDLPVKQINGNLPVTLGKEAAIKLNDGGFDGIPIGDFLRIVDSCKGLVCLAAEGWGPFVVCNPVMSDYVMIDQKVSEEMKRSCEPTIIAGFGFSPKTSEYKVIRFVYPWEKVEDVGSDYEADVCTLGGTGDEEWRHISCTPKGAWSENGVFFERAVHWLLFNGEVRGTRLVAFDCDEEIFISTDLPRDPIPHYLSIYLSILHSQLCLYVEENDRHSHFWVMDEYGVKESWRKLFVISSGEINSFGRGFEPWKVLGYSDEEVLLLTLDRELVSYDLTSNTSRAIKIPGFNEDIEAILLNPVFLPTKSLLMQGKESKIKVTE